MVRKSDAAGTLVHREDGAVRRDSPVQALLQSFVHRQHGTSNIFRPELCVGVTAEAGVVAGACHPSMWFGASTPAAKQDNSGSASGSAEEKHELSNCERERVVDSKCNDTHDAAYNDNLYKAKKAKSRPWSQQEDAQLARIVARYGTADWCVVSSSMPGRSDRQCRDRYLNHVDASVNKAPWTDEEDAIIVGAHACLGNRWSSIVPLLQGRTANAIKNRFNATLLPRLRNPNAQMKRKRIISGCVWLTRSSRATHCVPSSD